jgi:hypothetical protein
VEVLLSELTIVNNYLSKPEEMLDLVNSLAKSSLIPSKHKGDRLQLYALHGVFAGKDIDWFEVGKAMENMGYQEGYIGYAGEIAKHIGLHKDFPKQRFSKFLKGTHEIHLEIPGQKDEMTIKTESKYCKAVIITNPKCMIASEALDDITKLFNQQNVLTERANNLTAWLGTSENKGSSKFFDLIYFKVIVVFDIKRYLEVRKQELEEDKKEVELKRQIRQNRDSNKSKEFSKEEINDDISQAVRKISEIVAEKIIFSDFQKAFKNMATSPFVYFTPKKWVLSIEDFSIENEDSIQLGDDIKFFFKLRNRTRYQETLSYNSDFVIKCESTNNFFNKPKNSIDGGITATNGGVFSSSDSTKKITLLSFTGTLSQDLKAIVNQARNRDGYPIFLKVLEKDRNVELASYEAVIKLKMPTIRMSFDRTSLPFKGSPINVNLNFESDSPYVIPIKVTATAKPDFKLLNEQNENTIEKNSQMKNKTTFHFTLIATRAGFPGYKDNAFFKVFIGSWDEPIAYWTLSMTVLPGYTDMAVASLTALAAISSQVYPATFSSFLNPALNVGTLSSSAGVVYLGFRGLFWALNTNKQKSGEN